MFLPETLAESVRCGPRGQAAGEGFMRSGAPLRPLPFGLESGA